MIQAKVIEEKKDSEVEKDPCGDSSSSVSTSEKKEIIDECLEKMKEYIERKNNRF